jgi:hypothetical protein
MAVGPGWGGNKNPNGNGSLYSILLVDLPVHVCDFACSKYAQVQWLSHDFATAPRRFYGLDVLVRDLLCVLNKPLNSLYTTP